MTQIFAATLAAPLCAYASVLTIKNDDSTDVDVIIEGSIIHSNQIKYTLKPKQEQKVEVTKEALGDVETFSVTGKVRLPSIYNKCSPLFIDKNYKIIFVGSKAGGTICISEPVR